MGRIKHSSTGKESSREETILVEATRLFREKGYAETSVEDISGAVGLLKGSIYYYFKSKQEILYRIVKPPLEATVASVEKVVSSDLPPREKLHQAVRAHLQVFDDSFPEVFVYLQENFNSVGVDMRREIIRLKARYDQLWGEIIGFGVRSGDFRPDLDARVTSYAILGMCNWMYQWYAKGKRCTALEIADLYFELLTRGLLRDGLPDHEGG